jgi:hypothetical protein
MMVVGLLCGSSLAQAQEKKLTKEELILLNKKLDVCVERETLNAQLIKELYKGGGLCKEKLTLQESKEAEYKTAIKKMTETIDLQTIMLNDKTSSKFQWVNFVIGVTVGVIVGSLTTGLLVYYLK